MNKNTIGRMRIGLCVLAICVAGTLISRAAEDQKVDFVRDVQPLLKSRCYSCHGAEKQESGLRLDSRARALAGGDVGKAVIAGDSANSRLIRVITGTDDELGIMPPEGEGTPLSEAQVDVLRRWIDAGAVWPDAVAGSENQSSHWSLQPIKRPVVPPPSDATWIENPIDAFVLRQLQVQRVDPSPPADRTTLLRRLYLDLLGVPPSIAEVDEFTNDKRPDAYSRLVDRVQSSIHYGERWGRHWLDLARYADSDGYEKDRPRPHAWRYRQWVIDALNADLPFDRFSVEQLAGDMLEDADFGNRLASGFHRNTLHNTEGGTDQEEDRVKKTVDRTNTFGSIWLGITVGCAQCHTHKYDPLTQREYYSLYAFFNSINEVDIDAPSMRQPAEKEPKAMVVTELEKPRQARVHLRGDFLNPGDPVPVSLPSALPAFRDARPQPDRLDLAAWLFDDEHPLTARVTANRIWQRLLGRGIVATVDDFGTQGERPSHPQLLDWLATDLRERDWSLKQLQRRIVTSATYRQSSATRRDLLDTDPQNIWLARQTRRRVEAEVVRDLALAACGVIDRRVGGPSVRPPQPKEYSALTYANSAKWAVSTGGNQFRRGIYTFFQRTSPYPMLMTFDSPDSNQCTAERSKSNTPLQALTLWNDQVFFDCARRLGLRIVREVPHGSLTSIEVVRARAEHAFRICFARLPEPRERQALAQLFDRQYTLASQHNDLAKQIVASPQSLSDSELVELASWTLVARTLINLDEFVTRE